MTGNLVVRMHDVSPSEHGGAVPIDVAEASSWNARGYGIFGTVNRFSGNRRTIANLERIEAWAIDMDEGTKQEQEAKLKGFALVPSIVVETKRGFQAYWRAKDAKPEHWNGIMVERLVPYFGADKNARDIARILRMPGFRHLKNPNDPFPVVEVHRWDVSYREYEMVAALPEPADKVHRAKHDEVRRELRVYGDDFWERVYNLDCVEGLRRLSGSAAVGGEHFTFHRTSSGNMNILVDGKGTSCWVDKAGRIGSLADGGPTLFQWLRWYRNSGAECVRVLKQAFPQLDVK